MIEPALSALTRAVTRLPDVPADPYLLINFTESATEIAIVHEGRLLLDYRPGGAAKPEDLPALLDSHLNRLNRHVARYLRTSVPGIKHAFLCGEETAMQTASKALGSRSPLEIRLVRPADVQATWELTKDAAQVATAPVLGGLLASYLSSDDVDAPNLMQHILEGRQEPLRPRLIRSGIPLAATVLMAIALAWLNSTKRQDLAGMQSELDGLATASARATELRLQLTGAQAKLHQLETLAGKLPAGLSAAAIRQLGACMPSDVWLSQLSITDRKQALVQGSSYLEAGVYDFVRWLELAPGFAEVALRRTSTASSASGPATSFELELSLSDFNDQAERVARHE